MVSVFHASKKLDSDLELDAGSFLEFWNPLGMIGFKIGWEGRVGKAEAQESDQKNTEDSWEPKDTLKKEEEEIKKKTH